MPTPALSEGELGFGTPWADQIAFLKNKLRLPTERWDDIMRSAHDRAFIVAGAAKADLLDDLHHGLADSMVSGQGERAFQKAFPIIVAKNGWTGWTGEGSPQGVAWRAGIIYQTNMSTSYASGRWRQMTDPAYLKLRPYWRYNHADGVLHPRKPHLSWNKLTLRYDHPFWKTHFCPNGWRCHCWVNAVDAPAAGDPTEPPAGWDEIDPKTGAQVGIDTGFDYAPGANVHTPMAQLIDQKLLNLSAPIGAQMAQVLEPVLAQERRQAWRAMVDTVAQTQRATGETLLATVVKPKVVAALADAGVPLENAAVWLRDHELLHALRDSKATRGATLGLEVWQQLPDLLDSAVPYLDTEDQALIYLIELPDTPAGAGKVVVRVNYNEKGRFDGQRAKITSNFIQTGGLLEYVNIAVDARYVRLGT